MRARSAVRGHIAALDGVRGLAIVMVLFVHFVGDLHAHTRFEHLVTKLSNYGVWGVDLFFVLSGFLITGILCDAKGGPSFFKNFYVRRTLRIFPLYYAVLSLLFLVLPRFPLLYPDLLRETALHQQWVWPYATNIYVALKEDWALPYVSHFWSLAVEEHFYLVWPLIVFVCSRRTLLRVCVGAIAFSLGLRWIMAFRGAGYVSLETLTPCRLDALCSGAFLSVLAREETMDRLARTARQTLRATGVLIFAVSLWHATTQIEDEITLPLRGTLVAFFFGALIMHCIALDERAVLSRLFCSSWMRFLGKYSYGLYVFHGIIAYDLMVRHPDADWFTATLGSHALGMVVQAAAGAALSLLVAVASYELFEKPFLRLKDRFARPERAPERLPSSVTP